MSHLKNGYRLFFFVCLALAASYAHFGFAQITPEPPVQTVQDVVNLICKAGNVFFTFLMLLGVVIVLVAALLYLTAGGETDRISSAKKWLWYGIIGIGLAILAKGLVMVVGSFFDVTVPACS